MTAIPNSTDEAPIAISDIVGLINTIIARANSNPNTTGRNISIAVRFFLKTKTDRSISTRLRTITVSVVSR